MLGGVRRHLREAMRRQRKIIPGGFNWTFVAVVDITMAAIAGVAAVQRPWSDWPGSLTAITVVCLPWAAFFIFDIAKYEAFGLWAAWTSGVAIFLFATSTPIHADLAPLMLGLTVGVVGSLTSIRGGLLAAASAAALVCVAAAVGRLEVWPIYLAFVGLGWMVGYLMRMQQQLIIAMQEAQAQLAEHAAADERRRIAREVHDVIAHSLSVTLLHVTGARRALQQDRDVDDAVDALEQAESLGRQAMADIRHTVGLLDDGAGKLDPEPGVADIPTLVDDFARAGVDITLDVRGTLDGVSAGSGLALYRIAQESLTNVAKHAPDSASTMALDVSRSAATLTVVNRVPVPVAAPGHTEGRGVRGMRQRIELLGGTIDVGPCAAGWSVRAVLPMDNGGRPGRSCGP